MLTRLKALHKKYIPEPEPIVKVLDNLALVLYAIFIFEAFLRTTTFVIDWHPYYHLSLKVILILLVVAKSFLKVFDDLWVYILLFVCAIGYALAYLQGNHGILLEIILFTVLLKDIDFRKIAKVFFVVICVSLVCIFVASKRGMLTDLVYFNEAGKERHSFGVNYPTDFAAYILYLSLVWVFVRNVKISFAEIIVMGFVTLWVWLNCYARASLICMILLIAVVIMCKITHVVSNRYEGEKECNSVFWRLVKAVCNIVIWMVTFAVPICFIFSLLSAYMFDVTNPLHYKLNELLSDRLRLGKATFDTYDVKLFGQEIEMHGNGGTTLSWLENSTISTGYNFIDSSYLNIMFRYGFFVVVFTVLLLWVTSILAKKRKDYITLFIIVILAVHSVIEHHMLDIHYNPFIFMLFSRNYSKIKNCNDKKINLTAVGDKIDIMDVSCICDQKGDKLLTLRRISKNVFVIITLYAIFTSLILILDKREPDQMVYDVAYPVEGDDVRNDTPSKEIESFVEYVEFDGQYKYLRQNFYTTDRIKGIELWLRCDDTVEQKYSITIYDQAWEVVYSRILSSYEIIDEGFTRIMFDDVFLEQGKLYFFTIGATDYTTATISVGIVPRLNFVAGDLYIDEVRIEESVICFNLIYDYKGWEFINWMLITIVCVFVLMRFVKV